MPTDPLLKGGDVDFHGPSPILGPDGRPYRRDLTPADLRLLGEEVAGPQLMGTRQFWGESVASGMTPHRLAGLLQQAAQGDAHAYLTLAEEMEERDLNYGAALATRKRALSHLRPSLDVSGVEPRVAEAVRGVVEDDAFHSMVKDAVDALGKGYSVNEIVWGMKDGLWWPWGYRYRDPRFFTFDYLSKSELRIADLELIDGYEMPPGKFIRHIPKMKSGIPIRGGIARTVAWAWMFKSFALKDWAAFLDVFGVPLRVGKYHPNATPAERASLLRAVGSIASDAAAIIPESMQIDFVEAKNSGEMPFKTFASYLDDAIATYVLGQTLTTRDGGSLGQAKVHNEVRLDLAEDDAFELGVTINRELIAWFVALNFGAGTRAPKCEFRVPKPEVVSVLSTALGILVPLGLEVGQEDVRSRIGMPTPAPTDKLLKAPSGPVALPSFPSPAEDGGMPGQVPDYALNAARTALARRPDQIANLGEMINGAGGRVGPMGLDAGDDWRPEAGPMLDAVLGAARTSDSFDGFRAALETLYGARPTSDFDSRLKTAAARRAGEERTHDGR